MQRDNVGEGEGTVLRTRKVTRSKPFEAEQYKHRRHYFQHSSFEGWYEFEQEHEKTDMSDGAIEWKTWVLQLTMDKLGEVDITETRDGLLVAQWMAGQVVPVAAEQPQTEMAPVV